MTYTFYDYLDLAPGSSTARIEAAYAAVLARFRSSSDDGQDLSSLVRQIHAAYEVLSSPEKRESYDAALAQDAARADAELKAMLDVQPVAARLVQDVPSALRKVFAPMAA